MEKPVIAAFLSLSGTSLNDDEKKLLEKYNPLGITFFNRNLESKDQVKCLTQTIREVVGHDEILLAVDQEGGRVNRLKAAGFNDYAFQRTLGLIDDPQITALHSDLIANDMISVGINFNYAPVLDIDYPETTMALKGRCFGADKNLIAKHGKIMIQTYLKRGICPCIKHLPGHGRAQNDPHLGLPVIDVPLSQFDNDLYPFKQSADCPAAMTAHILIPRIDAQNPITLSAKGIDFLIRGKIGYDGFLISDALDMHALKGSILDKAEAAWHAGCDAVCYCGGDIGQNLKLCAQGRVLSDKALERYQNIKKCIMSKEKLINLDHNAKKYYSLISQFNDDDIIYDATEVLHQLQKGDK